MSYAIVAAISGLIGAWLVWAARGDRTAELEARLTDAYLAQRRAENVALAADIRATAAIDQAEAAAMAARNAHQAIVAELRVLAHTLDRDVLPPGDGEPVRAILARHGQGVSL